MLEKSTGMSLIEVLTALIICSLAVSSILAITTYYAKKMPLQWDQYQAFLVARHSLERAKAGEERIDKSLPYQIDIKADYPNWARGEEIVTVTVQKDETIVRLSGVRKGG